MREKLLRINSSDGIELVGLLFLPEYKTNKIVIHVHGMSGNFYENRFIDNLATTYINKGYTFIIFNNRGKDYISELHKGNENVIIGSCYEQFKDCVLDIQAIVDWAENNGYDEITLEGHSYGCNKVVYYNHKVKKQRIKNIILLAPCDIPKEIEEYTGDMYNLCVKKSKELIDNNNGNELIDFPIFSNGKISANTFYNDLLYGSECDFFRYREKNKKNNILNEIKIPVIVVFGDIDNCVLTQPIETVKKYLKNNINNCKIEIIENADHEYTDKCEELSRILEKNI